MMRPGSGTGAAPTRIAAAVYDSRSAIAPGDHSVLACCSTRAVGSWQRCSCAGTGAVLIFSAAAGIFQHALHSHPFIIETLLLAVCSVCVESACEMPSRPACQKSTACFQRHSFAWHWAAGRC